MVRGQERQARMARNQGGRRHPLGSPPSAPFPKGPGATHPFSQPLGFLPHWQVALPNSRPHLAVPDSVWKAPAGTPRLDPCPFLPSRHQVLDAGQEEVLRGPLGNVARVFLAPNGQ